ncbi:hypothetical protein BUALT_Bualt14G0115200 [Buddleja alternifolia]|uniref:Cupin type-1 domain-containing protein n=1 Tax=Buddleja alternifolia TaxID=168488 RepID=A0AAV6WPR1_9LAMI|nr:hypothetical protein BUALT_Bualt14G0115200 [Buddleja alternifolia]
MQKSKAKSLIAVDHEFFWQNVQKQQQHRLRARTDCRVQRLITAQEPTLRYESEAGRGLQGTVIPGCAETFETESQERSEQSERRRFTDRHQKIRQFRQGDVLALPAGLTLWFYNSGEEPLITVALLDTGNEINQLDQTFRNFFLAGNPYSGGQSYHRQRGSEEEQTNGIEETICTAKLRVNLDQPSRADMYNPRGGRIATLNSRKLPILSWLRLSAEKGVLYRNAIMAPHWTINAHTMIYVTRGSGRFQVVGHTGKSVFDDEVQKGQMIIVPQNYIILKRANEDQGLEWISFKTNDNAMTSQLAGRLSAIRALPEEVLMNSYQISREDAKNLKYRRDESRVFSPSRSSPRSPRPKTFGYALDVIKSMME